MSKSIILLPPLLLLLVIPHNHAATVHRFYNGDCPKIETMTSFNIDKFLGEWYIIENANDNGQVCLREEFIATQEPITVTVKHDDEPLDMARNELWDWKNGQASDKLEAEDETVKIMEKVYHVKRSYLPFGGRQIITETGKITFVSNKSQSEMEVSLPYTETGMLNLKNYEIIATDYNRFALVWRCQKTIFGHRRSAQLMTREIDLNEKSRQELQTLVKHFEKQYDIKFTPVRQTDCDEIPADEQPKSKQEESSKHSTTKPVVDPSKPIHTQETNNNENGSEQPKKNKKKLINIEVGGFQLTISYPFF